MAKKTPKYIRVSGWKRNPADKGPRDGVPPFLRWFGWKLNPAWEPTLDNIKVDLYLTGNIVPVREVAKEHRAAYRDSLARTALAAHRAGYGPGGTKGKLYVSSSYRSKQEQQALYEQNMIAPGVPKPGRPLTALPGTSDHGRGLALDVPDARTNHPFIDEARSLKMMDDVASEKWHLTNRGFKR